MMKKTIKKALIFAMTLFTLQACNSVPNKKDADEPSIYILSGNDKDEHGCKKSAGFQWSELLQECIQVFEQGQVVKETSVGSAKMAWYVVRQEGKQAVELFTPEGAYILQKEKEIWKNDLWELTFIDKQWNLKDRN